DAPSAAPPGAREELLKQADAGEINYTAKYIKKHPKKTLESIYKDYERQQLENTNNQQTDILIAKFTELMGELKAVKSIPSVYLTGGKQAAQCVVENKLLKKDLRNLVGYITPYIPLIGILSAGITFGKHVVSTKVSCPEKKE
ncbi:Hypothetical predicted protein, partial [Paramuricea clavata]